MFIPGLRRDGDWVCLRAGSICLYSTDARKTYTHARTQAHKHTHTESSVRVWVKKRELIDVLLKLGMQTSFVPSFRIKEFESLPGLFIWCLAATEGETKRVWKGETLWLVLRGEGKKKTWSSTGWMAPPQNGYSLRTSAYVFWVPIKAGCLPFGFAVEVMGGGSGGIRVSAPGGKKQRQEHNNNT